MKLSARARLGRRDLVRLIGGAALALPALELFARPTARAADKRARFAVFLYTPDGAVLEDYFPRPGESERAFTLSKVLEPLAAHRERLLVLGPRWDGDQTRADTGLCYAEKPEQHRAAVTLAANRHKLPLRPQEGVINKIDSPSIDQVIASAVQGEARFGSLNFGLHHIGGDTASDINYSEDGTPLRRMETADEAWERVLGGFVDVADPAAIAATQRALRREAALSDFLHGRFGALKPRLGKADRLTLDRHLGSLRMVERRRVEQLEASLESGAGRCVLPERGDVPDDDEAIRTGADTEQLCPFFLDVLSTAFACEMCRVASITFGYPGGGSAGGLRMPWLGFSDPLHAVSHHGNQAGKKDKQTRMLRWIASQVAALMDRLAAAPFEDGSVLDYTTIYWFNRHGDGNGHSNDRLPCILAGGSGGYFDMGRSLALGKSNVTQVLISIAHSMGVELAAFGVDEMRAEGPLAGLAR
jgi:hypothetical protein